MVIEAKYENGVFKPLAKIKLKEGTVVEIHVNREQTSGKTRSIGELGFAGMWSDREDIKDGVSYVNTLRDTPRAKFIAAVRQGLEELDGGERIPIDEVERELPHGLSSSPFAFRPR